MKDSLGNELKAGDFVMLQLQSPVIVGYIADASDGGIVTGINHKGSQVRPGRLVIMSRHTVEFDPMAPVGPVMALRNDAVRDISPVEVPKTEPLSN
jgi:hypothetical protein